MFISGSLEASSWSSVLEASSAEVATFRPRLCAGTGFGGGGGEKFGGGDLGLLIV